MILWFMYFKGSVIYGWDCEKREMIARLDVGKLLPVKESIEEELNSKPLQVCDPSLLAFSTNFSIKMLCNCKTLT